MKRKSFAGMILILAVFGACSFVSLPKPSPRMTKEELQPMLGKPDVLIVDVRSDRDWKNSEMKIKGSDREDFRTVESWANKYPRDKTLVFYCT